MELKEKEIIEEKDNNYLIKVPERKNNNSIPNPNKNETDIIKLFGIFSFIFILILLIFFCIFSILNCNNKNIIKGIYIKGIDVSGLTAEEAKQKITKYINESIPEEIILKHDDFKTSISTSDLSINFNIDEAIDIAYQFGKSGNIFKDNLVILESLFSKINVEPSFSINENQLMSSLNKISLNLPDKVIESGYYIDNTNLIITKGSTGCIVNSKQTLDIIKANIQNLNLNNIIIEIVTEKQSPTKINIKSIYNEIHKEPINAYYTQNPYKIYPSENGLDFSISLSDAENMLNENKSEYIIPLKILYPSITTNMIGTEAFPDLLSEFSTNYYASNKNRTTNLILAANKINGTVIMPGDTFSYNKVVGERTIEAGYKEAPIYVSGKVEDGLGGGICQITTTLYNAVLYANLEIIERSNHQFIPSYSKASRDATVVYGAIDFKFRNNRDYPIKLTCSVSNGIANFKIWGIKSENDYEVEISSKITRSTSTSIYSESYKTLKKNGNIVSTEILSKDTYKKH